jgi:uncharacterized protein
MHLVEQGASLGPRDLHAALRALELGFGVGTREELLWLCQTLWARNEEEQRRIQGLFQRFSRPAPQHDALPEPAPPGREAGKGGPVISDPSDFSPATSRATGPTGGVQIASADDPTGSGLPRALIPATPSESFIVTPKPLVPRRSSAIALRRFRIARRSGPRCEFDIDRTVGEKASRGVILEPALVARRSNQARIVLMVDVAPTMAAFMQSVGVLVDSLKEGQLAAFGVFYFHEDPSRLFCTSTLTQPVDSIDAIAEFPEAPALVVSDAGALRGGFDQPRIRATRECIQRWLAGRWSPIAWLNPMPASRWSGTSAAAIQRIPVPMKPFSTEGLTDAIDVLRGVL